MTVRPTEHKDFCSILSGSEIIQDNAIIPADIEKLIKKFDQDKKLFLEEWKNQEEIEEEQKLIPNEHGPGPDDTIH